MLSDPIGDMLARIKNGYLARKTRVEIPYSQTKEGILKVVEKEGFIEKLKVLNPKLKNKKTLQAFLRYEEKKPIVKGIKRRSKPGAREYLGWEKIPRILGGLGILILSTPKGLMTDEDARKNKLGGEVICEIW